jgi:hypothetical protein
MARAAYAGRHWWRKRCSPGINTLASDLPTPSRHQRASASVSAHQCASAFVGGRFFYSAVCKCLGEGRRAARPRPHCKKLTAPPGLNSALRVTGAALAQWAASAGRQELEGRGAPAPVAAPAHAQGAPGSSSTWRRSAIASILSIPCEDVGRRLLMPLTVHYNLNVTLRAREVP